MQSSANTPAPSASADEQATGLLAQRLESIAALTSGVAHDLMNTLAAVSMALDILGPGLAESERWVAGALAEDVRRGRDALHQIQWLAAARESEPLVYQPLHLLREMQKVMRQELPPVEVVTDHPAEVWLLAGEPLLLRQLLVASCLQVRSGMPWGGSLTLRAGNVILDEADAAQRPGARPGRYLRIEIESRPAPSLAAAAESAAAVWDCPPALLAALTRQGGFCETGPPVRFHLPAAALEPTAAPAAAESGADERGHGERILLVEPHPTLRALLAAGLERSGYVPLAAADGAAGLALLVQPGPPVAVAVCAAEGLLRDGTGVLRAIGAIRPGMPVLVTGPPAALAGVPAAPGIPVSPLAAPFTVAELVRALGTLLKGGAAGTEGDSR